MTGPQITHAEIARFASDRINLPRETAQKHRDQVNRLRESLAKKISEDPNYGLVKSLHAGSVAKGTALDKVNDLDLAVYVKTADAPTNDRDLVHWLAERLFDATTNMDRSQFVENPHCVTVTYKSSELKVDVVPVLYAGDGDYGDLVNKDTGEKMRTNIKLHLDFIAKRCKLYGPEFLELIRITKWWKRQVFDRYGEDFKFKSFMIELIWAHLVDSGKSLSDYPHALEAFFGWIIKGGLEEQLFFSDYETRAVPAKSSKPIEILDPVNYDNNVAVHYTTPMRDLIVAQAQNAFDALTEARLAPTKGQEIDNWQVILGPMFRG